MFYFIKTITKVLSLILALTLLLSFPVAASAVELTNVPTIDESKTGSLTIYKYDLTNAEKDGVWDSSYVSTGVYDEARVNNVLAWKRTSETFYDTLVDDAHIYTYGIDLTKLFSDGKGDFSKIEFLVQNKTDNYYVQAKLNQDEGVYYVTGHTENKADATHFVPVKTGDTKGRILIKGLEDDTYTMTEVRTDNGYVLLKQDIEVVISQKESTESCTIYASDALGLIQNDPRYAKVIQSDADLKNIPQKHLEHKLLTASATVSGKNVNMTEDNGSANAEAPLTVVNTRGFDLPKTGDNGTMMFTIVGILLMVGAAVVLYAVSSKKSA